MLDKIKFICHWVYIYCVPKFETHLIATRVSESGDQEYLCHVEDLAPTDVYDGVQVTEVFTWLGKVFHLSLKDHFPKENVSINFIDKE